MYMYVKAEDISVFKMLLHQKCWAFEYHCLSCFYGNHVVIIPKYVYNMYMYVHVKYHNTCLFKEQPIRPTKLQLPVVNFMYYCVCVCVCVQVHTCC